jgi:hypothetical protein
MRAFRTLHCGPHEGATPHEYKGDAWRCLFCEQAMLVAALRNLRCIAVSQGVSEAHGVIVNADGALRCLGVA